MDRQLNSCNIRAFTHQSKPSLTKVSQQHSKVYFVNDTSKELTKENSPPVVDRELTTPPFTVVTVVMEKEFVFCQRSMLNTAKENGTSIDHLHKMATFEEFNQLVSLESWFDLEARYSSFKNDMGTK
ncbi:hypothetical protein L1049_026660 [Liquidambar formosana]|uniref:Uncharacterized protein n=1 Tax=Liquidambar formosana TaxID=63359 RepID=A0AAP0NFD4_LIQFO